MHWECKQDQWEEEKIFDKIENYLYTCKHAELDEGIRVSVPFEQFSARSLRFFLSDILDVDVLERIFPWMNFSDYSWTLNADWKKREFIIWFTFEVDEEEYYEEDYYGSCILNA